MRTVLSCLVALSGLALAPHTAHAGGIGLVANSGFHEAPAYYYRDDGEQGIDVQLRPNAGFGGEFILGDRDDKIIGVMRLAVQRDWPVLEPDLSGEDSSYSYTYPDAHLQDPVDMGTIIIGIQWGLWGDPGGTQLVLSTLAGSGFATVDNLEFLLMEPGVGVTKTTSQGNMQLFATAAGSVRFRKGWRMGATGTAGVRYLFD